MVFKVKIVFRKVNIFFSHFHVLRKNTMNFMKIIACPKKLKGKESKRKKNRIITNSERVKMNKEQNRNICKYLHFLNDSFECFATLRTNSF